MSKIYLSRSISRTLSADHPVGDPTGGVAYGEKNDPVSAILSVAAMGGTYATAGTFAAMTVMQGITFAGAAVSLVGNITGNKKLSKIGMVAGIVGGLGQMGAFGKGIQDAKFGDSFRSTVDTSAIPNGPATEPLKLTPASTSTTTVAGEPTNIAAYGKTTAANAPAMTGGAPGVTPQANIPGSPTYTAPPPVDASSLASATAPAAAPTGLLDRAMSGTMEMGKDIYGGLKSAGSGLMDFTKKYPEGAMLIGQTAAPIAEYLSGKTDAEIAALEAQTGYADTRALQMQEEIAKEKRRRENLSQGYAQVNTGINVNPNASMAQQGLIAQQLQQA
jgi:hypothetical protein